MSVKVTSKGPGLEKAVGNFLKTQVARQPLVVVGVLGSTADRPGDGVTNTMLAVIHEFGLGVPQRSFLRSTFDKTKDKWFRFAAALVKASSEGKMDIKVALALVGEKVSADVKRAITSGAGIPPPNAPSTIARKGSSRPLVDTGRLVGSISYEVRSGYGRLKRRVK